MSKVKVSFLVVGLLAIAAAVLAIAGTDRLNTPSTANADVTVASTDAGSAGSESSCSKSASTLACSKTTATAAGQCPSTAAAASSCSDKSKACGSSCSSSCASACGAKQAKTASIEPISKREGERVVLVGHYVCGSCDLGVSKKCAAAFQTKDGKNYLLAKNNLTKDLKAASGKNDVEIITTVKKYEGEKYLEVETVNPVS